MDFDGVRALVVLPELPVAGEADGGAPASELLDEPEDWRESAVEFSVLLRESFARALLVLPEFAPAVGFAEFPEAEMEALRESFEVLLDRDFFAVGGVSPELACPELDESAESAAGFFFFFDFVAAELL